MFIEIADCIQCRRLSSGASRIFRASIKKLNNLGRPERQGERSEPQKRNWENKRKGSINDARVDEKRSMTAS